VGAWRSGLRPQSGTYASVFYGLTMFHGLHVLIGLLALAGLAARTIGHGTTRGSLGLRLWTLYFHMVAVLWLVMFVGVFLL
jgi:cytochrome c oxidase subunit 3